ncbi:AzlD domain-containing protein [Agrilactobacillus fermenti]|uniref:AzlD domain-containing protein n=1 Tax=Agrilactobacillus fermenti TaxID=2586909 RepID=UPI003A5C62A8
MSSFEFTFWTIVGCGLVTWLSRIIPFILLKKFRLPTSVIEFLSFVPIVIMSALWFESLFHQNLGHLPQVDVGNMLASLPAILTAILTKNLLWIVIIGILSLALIRLLI